MATLSLSVQVPDGNAETLGDNGWREQSSISQLLEKLRREAEGFADPKVEDEVSDDKRVKANEKVTRKVESIFKKPHRAAGKLTPSERKFEADGAAEKNEVTDENDQVKVPEQMEVSNGEKKRVRLTIGVRSEDDLEKKKRRPK